MRPRSEKVAADLFSHKVRSLLVIASIAVGVFAIGMITINHRVLSRDMRSGYRAVNPANIIVDADGFDDDLVERVRRLPGIAEVQGARLFTLLVHTASGEWKPVRIKALDEDDLQSQPINRVRLLQGTWPPAERQLALDTSRLSEIGYQLGDTLEIKLPSGAVRRMQLTAVVQDQTIGAGNREGGYFLALAQGYVPAGSLAWLEQPERFNTLYATVSAGQEDRIAIRAVAEGVLDELEEQGVTAVSSAARASSEHPNLSYVDAIVAVIYVLSFLVVFLSGFLITNTLSALLKQQVQQIGVMKTLGGTRAQIVGVYMVLILAFSLAALAVSAPLSHRAGYAMLRYLSVQINFELGGTRPVPEALLLQALVALLVPQAAGIFPILQGTRVSVRAALSGEAGAHLDAGGLVYRALARVRTLSRPLLISLRNTFRQRVRLALTLVTLALGGAIFIATLNVRASVSGYTDRLTRYFLADVNVTFSRPYRTSKVAADLLEAPGVERVEGWSGASAQLVHADGTPGESLQLLAPPAGSPLVEPLLLRGRWIQPGDQNAIALSELFLDYIPGLEVGQTIRLKIAGEESDWVVVGLFQFAGRSGGLYAYTSFDYLARQTGLWGRSAFFRLVGRQPHMSLVEQEALARQVETYLRGLGYAVNEVTAGRTVQQRISRGLDILTTTLLILSLMLAAVGSIGLMGTMSLNVMERTREIGVMRAIGGSDRAILGIVLTEGVLIGLISWLLASAAAFPISRLLADRIFLIIFDRPAEMVFTPAGNLVWLGVVLLLSMLASALPARSASRLTIREVLAYE